MYSSLNLILYKVLDTPPISPPLNNSPPTSPNPNTEIIKVFTLGPNGTLLSNNVNVFKVS